MDSVDPHRPAPSCNTLAPSAHLTAPYVCDDDDGFLVDELCVQQQLDELPWEQVRDLHQCIVENVNVPPTTSHPLSPAATAEAELETYAPFLRESAVPDPSPEDIASFRAKPMEELDSPAPSPSPSRMNSTGDAGTSNAAATRPKRKRPTPQQRKNQVSSWSKRDISEHTTEAKRRIAQAERMEKFLTHPDKSIREKAVAIMQSIAARPENQTSQ